MSDTLPGIAPLSRVPCPYCNGTGSRAARSPLSDRVTVTQCIACSGSGDVPTTTAKIPPMSPETRAAREALSPEPGAPLFLSDDGKTVLARDDKGAFHPVADVTERTPDGFVARVRGKVESVSGTVRVSG